MLEPCHVSMCILTRTTFLQRIESNEKKDKNQGRYCSVWKCNLWSEIFRTSRCHRKSQAEFRNLSQCLLKVCVNRWEKSLKKSCYKNSKIAFSYFLFTSFNLKLSEYSKYFLLGIIFFFHFFMRNSLSQCLWIVELKLK